MRILPGFAALAVAAALAAAPAGAQTAGEPEKPVSEQLEELIRGLVESVEPALERLRDTFQVLERVDSLEHYREPEILPNGDIIIRRKPDAPPFDPKEAPGTSPRTDPGADPDEDPGVRT